MNKDEIDIMWQQAMRESIKNNEMYTRYHFAKLVAERALADPMREVQRLGQEIEQEPVAWMSPSWIDPSTRGWQSDSFESIPIEGWLPLYTHPTTAHMGWAEGYRNSNDMGQRNGWRCVHPKGSL